MDMDKDSGANFVVGFFFGAVVGAAIGLLYAPRPGRETREIIRHKAEEVKERAEEVAAKAKDAAVEAKHKVGAKLHHEAAGESK